MFNINWPQFSSEITPKRYRNKPIVSAWLAVLVSQVRDLHSVFMAVRQEALYKNAFTSQIIYLEKRLNDRFDPNSTGIYIDNVADSRWVHVFHEAEQAPSVFLFKNYNPATTYQPGECAETNTGTHRCVATSTGNHPDSSTGFWVRELNSLYIFHLAEYGQQPDYIIMVPTTVSFNIDEMKAIVNYYNAAGKRYIIQTY